MAIFNSYVSLPEGKSHRIHGAAIYGNMDPINKKPFMLALIYQHHGSVMGIAGPHNYPKWLFNIAMERSTIFNS